MHLAEPVLSHFMIHDLSSMTKTPEFQDLLSGWKPPKYREITEPEFSVSIHIILPSNRV